MMSLAFGMGAFGDPMSEWGYVTPTEPNGMTASALRRSDQSVQSAVAQFWFRLNWEPYDSDRPWFTLGVSTLDGPDLLAPTHYSPEHILGEEFAEVLRPELLSHLAALLAAESAEWSLIPPDEVAAAGDITAQAKAALGRVDADLTDTPIIGHNQGPPLDLELRAAIKEAVAEGLRGLSQGKAGEQRVTAAVVALSGAVGTVGANFLKGIVQEAGKSAYPHAMTLLASLYFHLHQAVEVLRHWLTWIMQ